MMSSYSMCISCRAESVGLYLSTFPHVVAIFGEKAAENFNDVLYANWLSLCLAAVKGLELYNVKAKQWNQAHSQARFVILNVKDA